MKKIFLAGGGDAKDSFYLDHRFSTELDPKKPLLYIPNAMEENKYDSALRWFVDTFRQFNIPKVQMEIDLRRCIRNYRDPSGIYIGGGNTTRLLREIRNSGFDSYLTKLVSMGVPIYGGSAGAIILGETILTAPESQALDKISATGLNLLHGFSVYCHYDGEENLGQLCKKLKIKIIAIPERSGVYLSDNNIEIIGSEPIAIFNERKRTFIEPHDMRSIHRL